MKTVGEPVRNHFRASDRTGKSFPDFVDLQLTKQHKLGHCKLEAVSLVCSRDDSL